MIPQNFIDELIRRSEIYDVVSGYVRLTKKGGNYFGLCPFHGEKTPSFSVNQDKQIYHCFGCGKGGGVINFIMDIEGLSYVDAIRFLARRANMEVPEDTRFSARRRAERDRLLELNREAARFYHDVFANRPEGYLPLSGRYPGLWRHASASAPPRTDGTILSAPWGRRALKRASS